MVNSNIEPNIAPLGGIRPWNLVDHDFDLLRSLKVKSNGAVVFSIYEFLLMTNSNHFSISHRFGYICTSKFSPCILSLGQHFAPSPLPPPSPPPLTLRHFFSKSNHSNQVDWLNTFWAMLLTDVHTELWHRIPSNVINSATALYWTC